MVLNWSDAWLMLAISQASQRGPATLETIIAAGDEINFLIFSPEELESGLVRLTEAGYIADNSGEFYLTDKVRSQSEVFLSESSTDKRLKAVQELLGAASAPDDQLCRNNLRYPSFSKERYEEAVRSYRGYF